MVRILLGKSMKSCFYRPTEVGAVWPGAPARPVVRKTVGPQPLLLATLCPDTGPMARPERGWPCGHSPSAGAADPQRYADPAARAARAGSPGWEGPGVNCRPRKSPLFMGTRGSPNIMNSNAQAAVRHGCPQAREGKRGPRWSEDPTAAPVHRATRSSTSGKTGRRRPLRAVGGRG